VLRLPVHGSSKYDVEFGMWDQGSWFRQQYLVEVEITHICGRGFKMLLQSAAAIGVSHSVGGPGHRQLQMHEVN